MFDTSEVLATFYGDESFPVEWKDEEEKKLFWFYDDNHVPNPVSPMYFSLHGWWGPTLDYMYRRFGFPIGCAWNAKKINGYVYTAISPRDPNEAALIGPYYGWIMPTYAENFLDWWQQRYLPEIKRNFEYLDTYDTKNASLQELMVFLEEAIDIQERHFRLHWILNLAQFQASLTFQILAKELIPDVDGALLGRILISLEDRNWDSVRELWQLKEEVKANPELKQIFDSKETASAIIPALQTTPSGRAFMEKVQAYLKEYGYKPLYTHEYIYKLWVEDPTPCVETIKGYLVSDYNFPEEYEKIKNDQQSAMRELMEKVPADAPAEKKEALQEAMRLAVKMMPLTPDHHFYFDQGTFARMRLVLLAIGRKMVEMGLLRDAEDIMFLEYDQLRYYVANPKSESNPNGYDGISVIKEARRKWEDAFKITPRDWVGTVTRWNMYEEIYHTLWGYPERFERAREGKKEAADKVIGLPAAAGVAEGYARIVKSPDEFDQVKRGEIMVCLMTNPAWVIVFSKIKGVVTDAGGVLSHTAVVSREFGIPAVVGTGDATRRIKTGDRVRVNGFTGVVEILETA
ncbi:MAG: Phosphoenolpyruvate synthase [Anaerolineae bacterium]|jgi:pyruvate,water dikinase|nr:MAG: Phosphoenolpyruvate synthase [Anaerolineae bacterium]